MDDQLKQSQRIHAAISPEQTVVNKGWIARMPRPLRKSIEWFLIVALVGFIVIYLTIVRRSVIEAAVAASPPINFLGDLVPEKHEYKRGEIIKFHYIREIKLIGDEKEPILTMSMDCFENLDDGEVYPCPIIGRVIQKAGRVDRIATRKIPEEATPGRYIFQGWMRAETLRRTMPFPYQSTEFIIVP